MPQFLPRLALFASALLLSVTCHAAASEHKNLNPPYNLLVPAQVGDGPILTDLTPRPPNTRPWREVGVAGADGVITQARVSVAHGLRAMYSYPGEEFYANVKVETSAPGSYAQDREHVLAALKTINASMVKAGGAQAAEQGGGERRGLEYHFAFATALPGGGMLHIFVPEKKVIISAYLLPRKWPDGTASETMRAAQHAFLFGYIDAIRPGVQ